MQLNKIEIGSHRTCLHSTLDDRVRDVLRVKFLIGLFDRPYIDHAKQTLALVNSAAHQQVALRAARESIVLLKNDKNVLPMLRPRSRQELVVRRHPLESRVRDHFAARD